MTKEKFKIILNRLLITILVIIIVGTFSYMFFSDTEEVSKVSTDDPSSVSVASDITNQPDCPIMGIALTGEISTYDMAFDAVAGEPTPNITSAAFVTQAIRKAEKDDKVFGLILEIDSGGGNPVASEEIANALKLTKKPTVAVIRGMGASGAYWASTGADYILASANSDVGSIGVTFSYLDYSQKNQKEGITYVELNSAKYKNSGDPDRPLTEEERILFQRDLDIVHNNFVKAVAENRKLDIEKVKQLADGSTMLGAMALENGLIDKIGGQAEAIQYFIDKGAITEPQEVCWY
ncbi:MAG: signal peptide peptidase SppA [bacterium]|nr:signal peptide peptidase SppA [bacterium]